MALLFIPLLALLLATGACVTKKPPSAAEDTLADPLPESSQGCPIHGKETALSELVAEIEEEARSHFELGYKAYSDENWSEAEEQFALSLAVFESRRDLLRDCPELAASYHETLSRLEPLRSTILSKLEEESRWLKETEPAAVDELAELDATSLPPEEAVKEQERIEQSSQRPQYTLPMIINSRVLYFIDRYKGKDRSFFEASLRRSGSYLPMIEQIFHEAGVPGDLSAMALVESGFKMKALSRARAYGMWQFMKGTARLYDLRIDAWQDERADPLKATRAAAAHLKDLHQDFGDWYLAMAAYNAGKGRVERAIRRAGTRDFWELARTRHLARETRNYVPAVLASVIMMNDPENYGFHVEKDPPLLWDVASLDSWTSLEQVAECAGTDLETIRRLNPDLKYNSTPPNRIPYEIKIPSGRSAAFTEAYALIPEDERIRPTIHRVRRGDTLYDLARQYGTKVTAICQMNGIRSRSVLHIGQQLLIPEGPSIPKWASGSGTNSGRYAGSGYSQGERINHRVRRGDSLYKIAKKYGTTTNSIAAWNGISVNSLIHPGQHLVVHCGTQVPRSASASGSSHVTQKVSYRVRRGDTLTSIARKFNTSVGSIRKWNSLPSANRIYTGDRLTIFVQ